MESTHQNKTKKVFKMLMVNISDHYPQLLTVYSAFGYRREFNRKSRQYYTEISTNPFEMNVVISLTVPRDDCSIGDNREDRGELISQFDI